jgi:2-C-methyl-D-erythritol 2,4-cyclodiphosphate synthase
MTRIGIGYDVHRLAEGIPFFLGGVKIEYPKGAVGHSDADVLIHAICDALLGAANHGDIGLHFPDHSEKFKDIDSKILLAETYRMIREQGYGICNIDTVVILEKPRIRDYIPVMRSTLAEVLDISPDLISIKATTSEKIGFVGREEGIEAQAIVLIQKN